MRLARIVRLVLWTVVILLLAGGGLAYSCAAEVAPHGPVAASLCPGHPQAGLSGCPPGG